MAVDIKLQQLHMLCETTNRAWHQWFKANPGEYKRIARLQYLAALNEERMLYDIIMQEDSANTKTN